MASIGWLLSVQVPGSPAMSVASAPVQVDAIDRIEATIAAGDVDKVFDVQPGGLAAVRFLLIKSDVYDKNNKLTFKTVDGNKSSSAVALDGPQLFSGGGVTLLGQAPKQLKFTNNTADAANVEIYVARDATP